MIEKHVVSLDVAKKLPKGFESEFSWYCREKGVRGYEILTTKLAKWSKNRFEMDICESRRQFVNKAITKIVNDTIGLFPAPILSEMLELLPKVIKDKHGRKYELTMISNNSQAAFGYKHTGACFFPYRKGEPRFFSTPIENSNPATAAAQLLMWLVGNKYVEVANV